MNCKKLKQLLLAFGFEGESPQSVPEIKDHLQACESCKASVDIWKEAIDYSESKTAEDWLQRIASVDEAPLDSKPNRLLVMLPALAAVAALVIFFVLPALQSDTTKERANDIKELAEHRATEAFYIFKTQPETQELVAQHFKSFELGRYKKDDAFGDKSLAGVHADSLELQEADGAIVEVPIAQLNTQAIQTLQEEIQSLQVRFRAGQLQLEHLNRLQEICFFGEAKATALLEEIANSSGTLRHEAENLKEALARIGKITVIRNLKNSALSGSDKTRKSAIRVLAGLNSPQAMQALAEVSRTTERDFAIFAIQILATKNPAKVLRLLQSIESSANSNEAKAAAAQVIENILSVQNKEGSE